jgi:GT2 family glycosyltransferase
MTRKLPDGSKNIRASIVLYNSDPEKVRAAIQSCLWSRTPVDLTVIDNSPSSEVESLVSEMGITYVPSRRNVGFGAGHNVALRESLKSARYHIVLNPDVRFGPEVVGSLRSFMDENREVGLVMPQVLYPDQQPQLLCKRLPAPVDLVVRRFGGNSLQKLFQERLNRYLLQDVDLTIPRMVPALSGCFMFLRATALRQVGLFDERFFMYMEDVDLCRRIGEVSKTMFYPDVSIYHDYGKGSYRDTSLLRYHVKSAFRYFQKWGWIHDRDREMRNRDVYREENIMVPAGRLRT